MNEWTFRHFQKSEFACNCNCGFDDINYDLVRKLEIIRDTIGMPLKVLSGCRCAKHNKAVGGEEDSAHLRGNASDIEVITSRLRNVFLRLSFKYFTRRGIYKTFIHVDVDESLPQNVTWVGLR